ncbi:histone H1A, sperm-like [Aphis craccivora]|uniref:Histone H1A, sperm-like n=1 Tax=Aphis craccivora TaxID=307492 RepID=A0A6G0YN07_APHCR|nr:histone H1A, sperm-like [Aphis craccivora]
MATAAVQVPAVIAQSPKKKPATTKSSAAPAHPSTAVMVVAAITGLKEKKGSSLSAIKKYMVNNYRVDSSRLAPFIRKFLKAAVVKGSLVQTNGNGAMGHFKLPVEVKKKPVVKKPSAAATAKKKIVKKPTATAVTPKKRKLTAKKASATSTEPAAKKPKKSLIKAKKLAVVPKPPKVKKTATIKQTNSPKQK